MILYRIFFPSTSCGGIAYLCPCQKFGDRWWNNKESHPRTLWNWEWISLAHWGRGCCGRSRVSWILTRTVVSKPPRRCTVSSSLEGMSTDIATAHNRGERHQAWETRLGHTVVDTAILCRAESILPARCWAGVYIPPSQVISDLDRQLRTLIRSWEAGRSCCPLAWE